MGYAETALALHLQFPREYIALSRGFTASHRGVDMCWNSKYGGCNAIVTAPADGVVVALQDGKGNDTSSANWGNGIKIKHADGVYTLMAHLLKGSFMVKLGDTVKRGQSLARMNNSGYSFGCHVHYEVYIGGSGTGYRADPLKYTFAYPEQVVSPASALLTSIQKYTPVKTVGTPVARSAAVDQIEVTVAELRARKAAGTSGEVLGYIAQGYFNYAKTAEADGYTWYMVEPDVWVAIKDGWGVVYPAPKEDTKDKQIRELTEAFAAEKAKTDSLTALLKKYTTALDAIEAAIKAAK